MTGLLTYLDEQIESLNLHLPAAVESFDAKGIHQARVATRRLKAGLDLVAPLIQGPSIKLVNRAGRRIRRRLGPLRDLDVTWAARTERPDGRTSPEELAAAAHSSCFAMALSLRLGEHRRPPQQLRVEATVTLDEVDGVPTIVSSQILVRAQVPGLDGDEFQRIVDEAAALCPVSRLFAGARIGVEALLESN